MSKNEKAILWGTVGMGIVYFLFIRPRIALAMQIQNVAAQIGADIQTQGSTVMNDPASGF